MSTRDDPRDAARSPLPIEPHLDAIADAAAVGNLVLVAEPGAGKTTFVPPKLLERAEAAGDRREIVVLAPRRMAVRLAARRVAALLGEVVGERCGYQVRFEQRTSSRTQIRFMTEGLFTRRLRADPTLRGVGTVVFDELHERHLDTDLGLALARALQTRSKRSDAPRIVAMSATIDADPVARFLDAPVISVPGRTHPVEIEHRRDDGRPLARRVLRTLTDEIDRGLDGHVLVFLPGASEIRRCTEACEPYARAHGMEVHPLHGELPPERQDLAVAPPADPAVRKLILATNVAETSVTIDGVAVVIDSGLARIASHDPWTGVGRLDLSPISRASAEQRAGRAGRTRAGRCVRLYGRGDFERRRAFDRPEIASGDLSGLVLDVAAAGHTVDAMDWLEAPPGPAVEAAEALLRALGALDEARRLTACGRALLRYPLEPRLAKLLHEGVAQGIPRLAADVAALLSERPLQRDHRRRADADLAADPLWDLERLDTRDPRVDRSHAARIARVRKQLRRLVEQGPRGGADRCSGQAADERLCRALLAAHPDRVAQVLAANADDGAPVTGGPGDGRRRLALADAGAATLSPASFVRSASWIVALDVDTRGGGGGAEQTMVRAAAAIDPDWLIEDHADAIDEIERLEFDARKQRVVRHGELRYRGLLLEREISQTRPGAGATSVLRKAARAAAPGVLYDPDAMSDLQLRARFVHHHRPDLLEPLDDLGPLLDEACEGRVSFEELRQIDLVALARHALGAGGAQLDRIAPRRITLPGGRTLAVHYERDRPPWVASRLQDFFGSTSGPALLDGAVPLVLHLRAPNNRDVQVTTDLAGFWERHYPDLRKTLMRRYPKHAWPEDPRTASPPQPNARRTSRRRR